MADTAQHLPPESPPSGADDISITVTHRGNPLVFTFDSSATITDLSEAITDDFQIPPAHQKFLVAKHGMLKPPFKNPDLPLNSLHNLKIQLLACSTSEIDSLQHASDQAKARAASRAHHRHRRTAEPRKTRTAHDNYTFQTLRPLAGLPHPERSMALLERLRDDPGIRGAMRKHEFTVGLLTEMEPLSNTSSTHEGTTRLLGLNRNKGQVIELRLRTDAHDGYRDYKTIRKTLCHELAHNVHGDHDRNFWDLCHQIEREVDQLSSGHSLADGGTYAPGSGEEEEEDYPQDHGGWEGGEFVLGGSNLLTSGLTRSQILAQAASERLRRQNMETPDGEQPDKKPPGPSSIP